MTLRIRRPAVLFTLFSAIYWLLVADFIGVVSPLGGFDKQPYWKVALASMLPIGVYGIVTIYFCHWLVRRIVRLIAEKEGE